MTLSPFLSRTLALAILVGLVWAAHVFAVEPLMARYDRQSEAIARGDEMTRHYLRIGASRPGLADRLTEAREQLSPEGLYLEAASDALVAAQLQNRAKAAVEASGGTLSSTQILPAKDEGSFRRVGIRVQLRAPVEPLQAIFHTLESAVPYLFIDNVDIRRRVQRRRRRDAAKPEMEQVLTVRFDLHGYTRGGAS